MPIVDSVVCNYGNQRTLYRYRALYDCCGEFACIELIAPNLDALVIYFNQMNINVTINDLQSVQKGGIWKFNYGGIEYYIYKMGQWNGIPQQFYRG